MLLDVSGTRIYCYTGGKAIDPALPSVIFIHGAQLDHSCWALQSRYFAHHGFNSLAVDLPGHGRSQGAPLASIEALADWVGDLIGAAQLGRAALVGHSMGSLAALEAAARHPAQVTRIALLGSAVPMPVSAGLLEAALGDEPRAMSMVNTWSHSPRGQMGGNTAPGLWMYGMNQRLMERAPEGVLHNDLAACNGYGTGLESAARVRCPAVIVVGARDQMTPPKATKALAQALASVRTVVIEGAGHAMMSEQPDRVLDALRAFLSET